MRLESSLPAHRSLIPSLPAWDILNDPDRREKVLTDTDAIFPGLKSLDPVRMNISDLFSSILIIKNAQDEGRSLLKFTFQDREIVELDDPSRKSGQPSHILSRQTRSSVKFKQPAVPPTHTKVPDFSPERRTATSSPRAALSLISTTPLAASPPDILRGTPESTLKDVSFNSAAKVPDPMTLLPLTSIGLPTVSAADINTPQKKKKRKTVVANNVDDHAATKKQRIEVIPARMSSR